MKRVSINNFIPKYLLNPLSEEISKSDRAICLIASAVLGILTIGLLHLGVAIYQWNLKKVDNRSLNPNGSERQINVKASNIIRTNARYKTPKSSRWKGEEFDLNFDETETLPLPKSIKKFKEELNLKISQLRELSLHSEIANKLSDLANQITSNTKEILTACARESDLRKIIIDNIEHEFSELISVADGILSTPDQTPDVLSKLEQSYNQAAWVKRAMGLIREGCTRYTSEIGKALDVFLKESLATNTKAAVWLNGTALHHIAKLGKPIEFVNIFANNEIDFGHIDLYGNTALLWAIANGNNEIALEIINCDQDLNIQNHGNSALYLAIAKGYKDRTRDGKVLTVSNLTLIEKMANKGADPNLRNRNGYTSLHLACIRRDPDMITALLNAGGDLSILTSDKKNCLALLDMSYIEAENVISSITPPFLLPESEFHANKEKCTALLLKKRSTPG